MSKGKFHEMTSADGLQFAQSAAFSLSRGRNKGNWEMEGEKTSSGCHLRRKAR